MYDMRQVIVNYKLLAGQIKNELDQEFDDGRIKATEYADVFNKLMGEALRLAFNSPLSDAQAEQVKQQTELIKEQAEQQKYINEQLLPIDKQNKLCELELCKAKVKLTEAQAADQEYITEYVRPVELDIKQEELEIAREKVAIAKIDTQIKQEELEIKRIELDIAREKLELARADAALKEAQVRLTDRQILGFDDNKAQKLFDSQMNAWAMMFSSGLLDKVPSIISGDKASDLYCKLAGEIGVPC
jgi:hypothetical protein